MLTLTLIPLTCWLCALLAIPGKLCLANEVEELVYARLLGRQQRLVLLACAVTVVTLLDLVLSLPQRIDPILDAARHPPPVCDYPSGIEAPTCYTRQRDGTWVAEALQDDGTRRRVGVVTALPLSEGATLDSP
jgi:hypothetical protein